MQPSASPEARNLVDLVYDEEANEGVTESPADGIANGTTSSEEDMEGGPIKGESPHMSSSPNV
jgi:hypothetical protein